MKGEQNTVNQDRENNEQKGLTVNKDVTSTGKKLSAKEKDLVNLKAMLSSLGFEDDLDMNEPEEAKNKMFTFLLDADCSATQSETLIKLFSKCSGLSLRSLNTDYKKLLEERPRQQRETEREKQTGDLAKCLEFCEDLKDLDKEQQISARQEIWKFVFEVDPVFLDHEVHMIIEAIEDFTGETRESLELEWQKAKLKFTKEEPYKGLPTIIVNHRFLKDITDEALEVLGQFNNPPTFFTRGGLMVRVKQNGEAIEVDRVELSNLLDRNASFVKIVKDGNGYKADPAFVPDKLAPNILGLTKTDNPPTPQLDTIHTVPVFTEDKTLLATEGYHANYKTLLRLRALKGVRSDVPINEAKAIIGDVFGDFPFAHKTAGLAHIYAMLLQPYVRPMIQGPTPLYLIDAPTAGTGKGLLCEVISRITTGKEVNIMPPVKNEEELEKKITGMLLAGTPIILLDNVDFLKWHTLAAALTSEVWQGRKLGTSDMLTVRNDALWCATGNNVEVLGDLPRRIIPIRLDAGVDKPYKRTKFKHEHLREWVLENRSQLISACLSIITAWIKAGCPKPDQDKVLGSFEKWVDVLGGIIKFIGLKGFLEGLEYIQDQAEEEVNEWRIVCTAWWAKHRRLPISAKDLLTVCQEYDPQLLLDLWGGRSDSAACTRIGHALKKFRDRVFGNYTISFAGYNSYTKNKQYKLEKKDTAENSGEHPQKPPQTTETTEDTLPDGEDLTGGSEPNHPKPPQSTPSNSWDSGGFGDLGQTTPQTTPSKNPVSGSNYGGSGGFGGFSEDSEVEEDEEGVI